jgi:hypothetical protein
VAGGAGTAGIGGGADLGGAAGGGVGGGAGIGGGADLGGAAGGGVGGGAGIGGGAVGVSAPDVGGASSLGGGANISSGASVGAPDVGGASNLGGGASISSGANVGGGVPSSSSISGGANLGASGAPDLGGASNLGGGASISSDANVGAVGGGATSLDGGASITGDAPSVGSSSSFSNGGGFSGSGDLQAQSGVSSVRDASNAVGHTSGQFGEESVNAQVHAPLGVEGNRIAASGGRGAIDTELASTDYDVGAKAEYAGRTEALNQRDVGQGLTDAAVARSGYSDPRTQVGMAETAEFNERNGGIGDVYAAQERVGDAKYAVANPTDAAMGEAKYQAAGEAQAHVPTQAKVARADANVVRDAAHNPEAAAEGQVSVRVEGAELEEEHKVGITGVVPPKGGGTDAE